MEEEDFTEPDEDEVSSEEEVEEETLTEMSEFESSEVTASAESLASSTEATLSEMDYQSSLASTSMDRMTSESSSFSDMEFDDAGSEAESDLETAEETRSETEEEHRKASQEKKKLMLKRVKFWSMIGIPSASAALLFAGLVYDILKDQRGEGDPDIPEDVELTEDLKAALLGRLIEWRSMPYHDLFIKIRKYVEGFELSPRAQMYMLNQLKIIIPQPRGLAPWGAAEFNSNISTLVDKYAESSAPKSLSLYDNVVAITRVDENDASKSRDLTVHEAADLCDNALGKIVKLQGGRK